MAEYTPLELSKIIGKSRSSVETYVTRKKLVKNVNKKIDTDNPVNALFLEKYKIQGNKEPVSLNKKATNEHKPETQNEGASAMMQLEYAAKKLQAKKTQKEIELKELELSRKRGELVNLEQTGDLISKYVHSTNNKLCESIQIFVRDICARHSIEISKAGAYELKVKGMINKINEDSVNEIFKSLDNE